LGQKANFQENCIHLEQGKFYDFGELKRKLLKIQYKPVQSKIEHGMFEVNGERIDIFSSTENVLYRLHFDEEQLDFIEIRDATSFEFLEKRQHITIWPATQFLQDITNLEQILIQIDQEKEQRIKSFQDKNMLIEAERIKKRVEYDIRMIRETGFV
jgi:excinuclease ABC subunit B